MSGKRGPNGGIIDIDDPVEVFPDHERLFAKRKAVCDALDTFAFGIDERLAGRVVNSEMLIASAAAKLCDALAAYYAR